MSDRDEVDDGMALAIDAARKLDKIDRNHELLRLFQKASMTDAEYDLIWEDFQIRFGKNGITKTKRAGYNAQAYFWATYFVALRDAVEQFSKASLPA